MATTTATLRISSSDLTTSPLSINASSTLMKAGLTTGLTQLRTGYESIATGTEFRLGPLATEMSGDAHDIASWVYICNKATDDTLYIDWGIHETMIGRLYAGDWMFIPWNASDDAAEIEIEAQGGAQTIEYAFFASDLILPTAAS
tara:strand:- start:654 stop:1088 length:435 start_codon:yes stop_codon:yes gene_type:complete